MAVLSKALRLARTFCVYMAYLVCLWDVNVNTTKKIVGISRPTPEEGVDRLHRK